jgi:hypothetical protein
VGELAGRPARIGRGVIVRGAVVALLATAAKTVTAPRGDAGPLHADRARSARRAIGGGGEVVTAADDTLGVCGDAAIEGGDARRPGGAGAIVAAPDGGSAVERRVEPARARAGNDADEEDAF